MEEDEEGSSASGLRSLVCDPPRIRMDEVGHPNSFSGSYAAVGPRSGDNSTQLPQDPSSTLSSSSLPPSIPPTNRGLIRLFTLLSAFSVRIVSALSLSLPLHSCTPLLRPHFCCFVACRVVSSCLSTPPSPPPPPPSPNQPARRDVP